MPLLMRRDMELQSEGVTLRGWFYVPDGAKKPVPTVIMAHGFSCLKEMFLDKYAEVFVKDGLAVLVYDNRCFGASDGEPRQEIDPILAPVASRDPNEVCAFPGIN